MSSLRFKLNSLKVNGAKKSGLLSDGGSLYLQIASGGNKSWIFRFMLNGRAR